MLSAENIGNFPFETRFDTGMLLEKPGHKMPPRAGSEPGQGRGPGSAVSPPRGARGPAPPQAPATVPASRSARPQTGLASAIALMGQHYAP